MKRILESFNRKGLSKQSYPSQTPNVPQGDSPESTIVREVIAFCESGAPNSSTADDECLYLPAIVEAAESSPTAAREGAICIRRFLTREYSNRAYAQYNAVMLMRILTDNPGPTFTRNFDATFVKTIKELLREGQDLSVQQILRETLESFMTGKVENETLRPLMEMWKKEKAKNNAKVYGNSAGALVSSGATQPSQPINHFAQPPQPGNHFAQPSQPGNHFARQHRQPRSLPPPDELSARIAEARTTAKLLSQTVQSTANVEIPENELVKEFADRASSASRSIQGYIQSTNPAPDENTLLTLIQTNDELSFAMSKHQTALLQARRALSGSPSDATPRQGAQLGYAAPHDPPPGPTALPTTGSQVYHPPQTEQDHFYVPPPNPPQQQVPFAQSQPQRSTHSQEQEQTSNYDVPGTPFTDQHVRQPYGLFNRPNHATPSSGLDQKPSDIEPPQSGAQNQMPSYQSTPSYTSRQESAINNLTMHSTGPSLDGQNPSGVQSRMANMRV